MARPSARSVRFATLLRRHFAQSQHRTVYALVLNTILGAATGFLFWLLLARLGGLGAATLGIGYSVVALGTVVGVVAKGGLDTALLQKVPGASRAEGARLLSFGFVVAAGVAFGLTLGIALVTRLQGWLVDLTWFGWALVAGIAILLVGTWLQDAYFVALARARFCLERNVVLSAGRLLLPLPVVALALADPVALTWLLALAASAVAGVLRQRAIPARAGRAVPRREFLRSSWRNLSGGAAEALPGLLLAPLVLAIDGPAAAAYFGIAWTAAALVFQTSAAIGRSALAQMIQDGPRGQASAIRKAVVQHLWLVAPMALIGGLFAPQFLAVFGRAYAQQGGTVLAILCASIVVVAPTSLYLAVLRARERSAALVLFPAAMIVGLALWAPVLEARLGLTGVALAWLLSNVPFGAYATWRLHRETKGVMVRAAAPLARPADLE